MSKVSIKIGPKTYTIATAPGDEARVAALGEVIDGHYQKLGTARAVQETDNLVFASLFLADELEETRKSISDAKISAESAQSEAQAVRDEASKLRAEFDEKVEKAVAEANANVEHEMVKSGGKKAELRAEIETLRKAEERAREENDKLKAELADMVEASRQQQDMFADDDEESALVEQLEALAERAEKAADALETPSLEAGTGSD